MRICVFPIVLALAVAASPLNGAMIYFNNDKPGWEAAVGGPYLTEDFNDTILNPGLSHIGGVIDPPYFRDYVSRGEGSTFWFFDQPIRAIGANWDLSLYSYGTGVQISVCYEDSSCEALPFEVPNNASGEFIGLVSDIPITSVFYTGGTQQHDGAPGTDINAESLYVDNLSYAYLSGGGDPGTGGQIPEPATLLLTGLGLTAAAWSARRRA